MKFVGLDIGGTKILAAIANGAGQIIKRVYRKTPISLTDGLDVLNNILNELSAGENISGIGIAIGGPLDYEKGIVSPLHQPEWQNLPLKQILEERWHCNVYIDVDTNVAALGEYRLTNEKSKRFLYLTLSTGMGGGFIYNGKIYRGSNGIHPEPGHISINYRCRNLDNLKCECGVSDCLEALISGNGIKRVYGKPAENLNEDELDEVAYNLGQGLRNMTVLYAPDIISLGGGISYYCGERLLIPAQKYMLEHLKLVRAPTLRISPFGYETALFGAVNIAINGL